MRFKLVASVAGILLFLTNCRKQGPPGPLISSIELGDDSHKDRIIEGVYPGDRGWRWTAPAFAVRLDVPTTSKPVFLELDLSVPIELAPADGPVKLVAKVNGTEIGGATYKNEGRRVFAAQVPAAALQTSPAVVNFAVDKPGIESSRPVGVIAVSVGLKELEQMAEYRDKHLKLAHDGYEAVLKQRDLQIPLEKQRELMKLFHELPAWDNQWFHGVRTIKNPLDLWMLQQIAYEVRPDFIIETGTWHGGSALWWAHTLEGLGLENSRVLTVDVQDLTGRGASAHRLWKKYVEFHHGSSTSPAILDKFAARVRNSKVLVNLDSDHSMQHVLRELQLYGPLVNRGSYMAVEDTHLDGIPTHPEQGAGPTAAIRAFLAEGIGKDFEQDFKREALVMTSYSGGWLKRK